MFYCLMFDSNRRLFYYNEQLDERAERHWAMQTHLPWLWEAPANRPLHSDSTWCPWILHGGLCSECALYWLQCVQHKCPSPSGHELSRSVGSFQPQVFLLPLNHESLGLECFLLLWFTNFSPEFLLCHQPRNNILNLKLLFPQVSDWKFQLLPEGQRMMFMKLHSETKFVYI